MARKCAVKLTANFESNLEGIELFLEEAGALPAYDHLLDEILETLIPNLERFPEMGRPFFGQPAGSVEVANASAALKERVMALAGQPNAIREYVLKDFLLLYAEIGEVVHLLAIRHHRQLSFDFAGHWG